MSERKIRGFTFWESYYETFQKIPNKRDKLLFINCILSYVFDGEMIDVTQNPIIDVAFTGIKSNLDNTIKQALNGQKKKANKKPNGSQTEANSKQEEEEKTNKNLNNKLLKGEKEKESFGTFENVQLTLPQYESICSMGAEDYIDILSSYMESTGKTYRNHYATMVRWFNNDKRDKKDRLADKIDNQFYDNLSNAVDDDELDRDELLGEFEAIRRNS